MTVERHGQAVVAICSGIGDMADLAERLDQVIRGVAVVLNDQKAHGDPIRLRFGRPAERALPLNIRKDGHRSHQFQSFRWRGQLPPAMGPISYARGWRRPPPPQRPHPSGGDGCQGWSSRSKVAQLRSHFRNFAGTGTMPAPLRSDHRRGRRMPAGRPQSRVSAAAQRQRDEARVVTLLHADQDAALCLRVRALVMTSRTSVGVETDLPATSRITSPVEKP